MNEKCPSCGNIVEGKKKATIGRKMTRGAVKKGATMATGAAIGSVIPGIGTAAGAVVGLMASEFLNETADDIYDASVGEIEYEFSCPKCGRKWTKKVNSLSQNQSNIQRNSLNCNSYSSYQTSSCDDNDFNWSSKFWQDYECYFDNKDEILVELTNNMQGCDDKEIRGHYLFFISFICLQYSVTKWNDNLFDFALSNIKLALSNNDNEEYRLLSTILQIAVSYPYNDSIFSDIEELDIESVQPELSNTEYWKSVFEIILNSKIVNEFLPYSIETNEYTKLLKLLFAYDFEDIGYKISICNMISDAYEELGSYSKQFEYTKSAVELADFENEFDHNDPDHSYWLIALENLGYCYSEGIGVAKDEATAFEIYTKCAKLGSDIAMRNLGNMYENGVVVEQNYSVALHWYNKALTAGYEDAEEDIKRILEKLGVETYSHGPYVPQKEEFYMDVEDVFDIEERGVVITGQIKTGCINVGDRIILINKHNNYFKVCQIAGIEMFRKLLDYAEFGDNVGLLVKGLENNSEIAKGGFVQYYIADKCIESKSKEIYTVAENEYLDELKACLEEDGEISPKERRLLERLREKLGISSERATELEATLSAPQLTDEEKEYLEEYKTCFEEDEEISPKERRLLNRLRDTLGISAERAEELEKLSKKH